MKKKPSAFTRYTDPTGEFSNRKLRFAQWYIEHKILLRKIFVLVLAVWSTITISIGLFVWGKYLVFDYTRDEQNISSIARSYVSRDQIELHKPQDIIFRNQRVFMSAKDKYDFVIEATNPNDRWIATVSFLFVYSGGQTEVGETVLLPGVAQHVILFGHSSARRPTSPSFQLVDVEWKRIDPHDVSEPVTYMAQRLLFSTSKFLFAPANKSEGSGSNLITFNVANNSLFGYWDGDFNVVYKDRGQIVGFAPLRMEQFVAGSVASVELASFMDQLQVDSIELEPRINVFDKTVYMPLR
ncbi:MAG TPA: hypothetical protein DCS29_05015 [Candidatus Magasanikbacteria bacterium]|nr:MAG: hypothetical protein A2479_04695 [Candidatus Magasanikbacteria bacterium RIFOXYC2_FULL_39_8]HAT04094.1 hypothetical protein [Candidatus Magasanikbacteria bacterium]